MMFHILVQFEDRALAPEVVAALRFGGALEIAGPDPISMRRYQIRAKHTERELAKRAACLAFAVRGVTATEVHDPREEPELPPIVPLPTPGPITFSLGDGLICFRLRGRESVSWATLWTILDNRMGVDNPIPAGLFPCGAIFRPGDDLRSRDGQWRLVIEEGAQ